jgi:DNA-binding NtrC family response regulator
LEYLPPELLPAEIRFNAFESNDNISLNSETSQDMNTMTAAYEKKLLLNALNKHHWNQSSAARELGVNEKTVRDKMKKYHIKKHSYK